MAIRYIDQLKLTGKKVIIRVDYNVPYDSNLTITDDTRITATVPTLEYCLKNDAAIILISHLGRPKGKPNPSMTLKPVAKRLSEVLKREVKFIEDPVNDQLQSKLAGLKSGEVALLENIRFYPEEEKNDMNFGKLLAGLGDVYIDDAFAAAHRGHSSNEAITHFMSEVAAGFLLKDEIEYFKKSMQNPERPLVAVIGGAKVSSKLDVLKNILGKVNSIIIGGGMAFTFLKAQGIAIGKSLVEDDLIENAREILALAAKNNVQVSLPVDAVIAASLDNEATAKTVPIGQIPADMMGLDLGPESIKQFGSLIASAKTVIWNGPMGVFEKPAFAHGTFEMAKAIADSGATSIIGGGDSVSAVHQSGLSHKMSYISTGGGAFLELMEGKTLPAIAALDK